VCIAYILYDPFGRQQEGFNMKKIKSIKINKDSIKQLGNTLRKLPVVKDVEKIVRKEILNEKSKKFKEGVCLPKTSKLEKGYSEIKNVFTKSTKSVGKFFRKR